MKQTAIFPGRYVQAEGALEGLAEEIQRLGSKALLIAGNTAEKKILPAYLPAWQKLLGVTVERFGGESSPEEVQRLTEVAQTHGCDVVVGMGGGKAIDTAKVVGYAVNTHVAIVPTIASTDAPTSAVAVLYTSGGAFLRYQFVPRNPELVLVDTQVIAEAPVRYLVAGMGDALATWFEADSCRTACAPNQCGGQGTLAGYALARLCYDTIREYGVAARIACEQKVVTPALSHVVEANTLLSGLGFEMPAWRLPIPSTTASRGWRGRMGSIMARRWRLACLPGCFCRTGRAGSFKRSMTSANRSACRQRSRTLASAT